MVVFSVFVGGLFLESYFMSLKSFKTNPKSVNEGVDIQLVDFKNADGTIPTFTVARMSTQNKKYMATIRKFNDKKLSELGVVSIDKLSLEQEEGLNTDTFVESIILGWENVEFEDGKKTAYSKENCRNILCAPEWFDLKARIEKEATNKDNFAFDLLEKKAGN